MLKIIVTAIVVIAGLLALVVLLFPRPDNPNARFIAYRNVLGTMQPAVLDEPTFTSAMERFAGFWSRLDPESVRTRIREVYDADVWFNDTVKTITTIDDLEHYMAETAERAETTVEIEDISRSGPETYVRWVMTIVPGGDPEADAWISTGITHLRFNEDGRVILHQDFWDPAGGIYEHLPVVGGILERIKKQF